MKRPTPPGLVLRRGSGYRRSAFHAGLARPAPPKRIAPPHGDDRRVSLLWWSVDKVSVCPAKRSGQATRNTSRSANVPRGCSLAQGRTRPFPAPTLPPAIGPPYPARWRPGAFRGSERAQIGHFETFTQEVLRCNLPRS